MVPDLLAAQALSCLWKVMFVRFLSVFFFSFPHITASNCAYFIPIRAGFLLCCLCLFILNKDASEKCRISLDDHFHMLLTCLSPCLPGSLRLVPWLQPPVPKARDTLAPGQGHQGLAPLSRAQSGAEAPTQLLHREFRPLSDTLNS